MSTVPSVRVPAPSRAPANNPPRRTPAPPFPPVQPKPAAPAPQAPAPQRPKPRTGQTVTTARPRSPARCDDESADTAAARNGETASSAALLRVLHRDSGDEDGDDGLQDKAGLPGDDGLDLSLLADEILPHCEDDGIFEVTLPDGQNMGVVVNLQGGRARIHLSPADDKLADKLRRRKMELQGHLERRMQRNVEITVL